MLRLWNERGLTLTRRLTTACVASPTRLSQRGLVQGLTLLLLSLPAYPSTIITSARRQRNTNLPRGKRA